MTALLAILARVLALVDLLVTRARDRRIEETTRATLAARQLKELVDAMDKTRLARARIDALRRDPRRLRDDDRYRRDARGP